MMFILVARLSLTYCTTSVAIVCKLLHVRYNDDWKKVCRCWFEFIVSTSLASISWDILQ
jgi:hypothetical protein